ncbi:MAG: deoxyribodipyrimidine photo-lyase [Gallionella sp.]|nr:deoxyribodipyrimidine photo-lyase [Gallionella sp.]
MKTCQTSLCWFRRDLRLHDHAALCRALQQSAAVHCVFVFDTDILDPLPDRCDRRVEFIWHSVRELRQALQRHGATLHILHGSARTRVPEFARQMGAQAVFTNRDYEPEAIARDGAVAQALAADGIVFHDCKDQVIFERDEVMTGTGKPYSVFTPYKNAWLKRLVEQDMQTYPDETLFSSLASGAAAPLPTLAELGFEPAGAEQIPAASSGAAQLLADFRERIDRYHQTRDFPALDGGSNLSAHLRFGTVSIRALVREAYRRGGQGAQMWLSELIWREFYQMLLYHHPRVVRHAFKPQFDTLAWDNDPEKFAAWREGRTGYPLVDAGMRQLARHGLMHNRLRMVTASFLVKDLQIDWRWGERHFADKLLDYDLAANNGGWQWAASTGCDAQPWFRIFNPVTQSEKFDPAGEFIRRHVPELASCPARYLHAPWRMPPAEQQRCGIVIGTDYPAPVVDHALAREKTLAMFKAAA